MKERTVGMLTFHYADNYGAVLQTYALYKSINKINGISATLINYIPVNYKFSQLCCSEKEEFDYISKRKKMARFVVEKCNLKDEIINKVTGNKYDIYCVGSDQVWNIDLPELIDKEYFLPNLEKDAKRVAYAASIGSDEINNQIFSRFLPLFNKITLREHLHLEDIEKICGKKVEVVLDPTFLLPVEQYDSLADINICPTGEYILFYYFNNDALKGRWIEYVNHMSIHFGCPVVHNIPHAPNGMFFNDGGYMWNCGVEEFLGLIKGATFVVSNSFHTCIFSILFHKQFQIIPPLRKSRVDELIHLFGIGGRLINSSSDYIDIGKDIEWKKIDCLIEYERSKSITVLEDLFVV